MVGASPVMAGDKDYYFRPNDCDLADLPHGKWFKWGINWNLPTGEYIKSASITYYNIYDWTREGNDKLFTHLLDSATRGVTSGNDNEALALDHFAGQGVLLGTWSDPEGGRPRNFSLPYDIDSSYFTWLSDGNFGFGIDPDCHYFNDKVEVKITTACVPEATTIILSILGLGTAALPFRLSRRR
jgi:hypothetical protein